MGNYKLSPRAQDRMRDIWRDIAIHNERAADKLLMKLFNKFELVAEHPSMGSARPELGEAVRVIIEGSYIALYEPTDYGVEIVTIVHSRRDPARWLDDPS